MGIGDIFKIGQFKAEIEDLKSQNLSLNQKLSEMGVFSYEEIQTKIENLQTEYLKQEQEQKYRLQKEFSLLQSSISDMKEKEQTLNSNISERNEELQKLLKSVGAQTRKISRSKELYKALEYSIKNLDSYEPTDAQVFLTKADESDLDEIAPSVILKLHCMDMKDLRKAYRENDKQINKILDQYASRYTTKANQAIYKLMVIALRSELQNILYNLKYEKLDKSIDDVKSVTQKYLIIAGEGNKSIAGTLSKFIGEIEYLFINSVKIEYNYYVKKEQAKQEQLAIREQMRQEAAERKALETERKKIEQEEQKYNEEIEKLNTQIENATDSELEILKARILELQSQLSDVVIKKEEISNLANGKAGNVYVISNLGSFGDNIFKIGMTRRLDPQDRVNELGDASVPFKFDVHSFIFSDDAVGLENKLHSILTNKRVNKVNTRKEFFYTSIDELEELVNNVAPSAEFNRTMLAEEFRQSQSSNDVYTSISDDSEFDDEDE